MDIHLFSPDLIRKENGIYFSKNQGDISYPSAGNESCYQLEDSSFWFKHRNNIIIESVKKYAPNECFFDIGGGNGFVTKGLEDTGIESVLVEPGLNGVVNALERGVNNIICSTLENAGFKESILPSIGLFDVVEHISDDEEFLLNIKKCQKTDGHIFITVPAYNWLWSNDDDYAGHYRRYTIKSMNNLLKKVGYHPVFSSYIFSFLPLPIFLLRSIPSKFGFSKNTDDLNKQQREHQSKGGIANNILSVLLKRELNKVSNHKSIAFGSSCFVIAKKVG